MCRIGLCVFCSLKFSVAVCMLLVKKLESVWFLTTKSGSLRNSVQKCGGNIAGRKDNLAPVMVPTLQGLAAFRRVCSHSLAQSKYTPCIGLLGQCERRTHVMNDVHSARYTPPASLPLQLDKYPSRAVPPFSQPSLPRSLPPSIQLSILWV